MRTGQAARLAGHIRSRDASRFESAVAESIREYGWSQTADVIRQVGHRVRYPPEVGTDMNRFFENSSGIPPVNEAGESVIAEAHCGTVRDMVFALLGLDSIIGLDVDWFEAFGRAEHGSLEELRSNATETASSLLKSQITERNTYFLSVDQMSASAFAIHIPALIKARDDQFSSLSSSPNFNSLARTYYGFHLLASPKEALKYLSVTPDVKEALRGLSANLGRSITPEGVVVRPYRIDFPGTSDRTTVLLRNILAMNTAGYRTRADAIDNLGLHGDSRVVPWLLERLSVLKGTRVSRSKKRNHRYPSRTGASSDAVYTTEVDCIMIALGMIGHQMAHDAVLKFAKEGWENAIWALGGIRSPQSFGDLIELRSALQARDSESPRPAVRVTRTVRINTSYLADVAMGALIRTEDPRLYLGSLLSPDEVA